MTFLNPLLLLGLVAAAIPLIIHLFNFRRPRRVNFSSLAFVQELQKSTMQRARLNLPHFAAGAQPWTRWRRLSSGTTYPQPRKLLNAPPQSFQVRVA